MFNKILKFRNTQLELNSKSIVINLESKFAKNGKLLKSHTTVGLRQFKRTFIL